MAMWKLANWPKNVLMGYAAKKISSISTVTLAMFFAVRQILTPETVADSYPVDSVADSYPVHSVADSYPVDSVAERNLFPRSA